MLSYMLPVEDKSSSASPSPVARNLNLSLNLNTTATPATLATNGMGAQTGLNGNSLVDVSSCDENTKLLASERTHILKQSPPRDLKLDNGIMKMPQTQKKPPLPPSDADNDTSIAESGGGEGGGGGGGGGTTTEDSSCCDTDSKSAMSGSKKSTGKLNKSGTKNVTLKRVSFGSSKGSMVETLVFETPTPLPEHAEREFGFPAENFATSVPSHHLHHHHQQQQQQLLLQQQQLQQHHHPAQQLQYGGGGFVGGGGGGGGVGGGYAVGKMMINNNNYNHNNNNNSSCMDDSGIEMQEELERSKVRVTFFQSSKPQQVSPPESYINYTDSSLPLLSDSFILDTSTLSESNNMTAATATQPSYDRQISTESGWDNPFRPGGDLSREADEIVNMIKGGKPITPTGDAGHTIANGNAQKDTGNHTIENGSVVDGATKTEVSHVQSTPAQNGTKSPQQNSKTSTAGNQANGDTKTQQSGSPQTQVSNQVIPGPISASHVVIEDKKKKKCTCCVIQ